ncbi:MAG: HAMP domain-containing protein [Chloroflexi bacterium]|nr:HAMP domain-containing protein [Chloroflexota bacterium]
MLKSLRSWLLFSYVIVIVVALLIIGAAMLAIAAQPGIRYFSSLQRLDALSRTSRNELVRLVRRGADTATIMDVLDETAVENNIRILVLNAPEFTVIYDSDENDAWIGDTIRANEIPRRLLPTTDSNTIAARFSHPNGSTWLLYSRALLTNVGVDRQMVVYAMPEPTPLAFFEELGFGRILFRAGLVAMVVAVLLGAWISRSVARPLQKLASAAEAIASGDYEQQLPLQGPEEVQRVAASFNTMSTEVTHTRNAHRDFVANVSHDLRTPITSIRGWSQALLDGTAVSPQDQQQAAGIINNESERMERMVADLLDLARIESGQLMLQRESLDMGEILRSVHQSFLPRAQEHDIKLMLETQPTLPVWGDHDRLVQVLSNLIDNALSHTPPGGTVRLALHRHTEGAVDVMIQDTGKGIPPEDLDRIFERFYQVDKSRVRGNGRAGSGLGLSIVQELVQLHNGRVLAKSDVGRGSTFVVRLPNGQSREPATRIQRR